jgi:hypothetical protein
MRASVASRYVPSAGSPLSLFPSPRASPASANGSVPPPVLSISLDFRHAANLYSDYSADICGLHEGDRRGSNPRPSEPQSLRVHSGACYHCLVCGLGEPKTRRSQNPVPLCVRLCSSVYCCRIAATSGGVLCFPVRISPPLVAAAVFGMVPLPAMLWPKPPSTPLTLSALCPADDQRSEMLVRGAHQVGRLVDIPKVPGRS